VHSKCIQSAFKVHLSSYKYWLKRKEHINADFAILYSDVKAAHRISNGSAGARTIAQLVTNKGIGLSRYRVRNLMESYTYFIVNLWDGRCHYRQIVS
jgi:putative transposase